jgi:hypothetical protein
MPRLLMNHWGPVRMGHAKGAAKRNQYPSGRRGRPETVGRRWAKRRLIHQTIANRKAENSSNA